jgi:hypothetical protein
MHNNGINLWNKWNIKSKSPHITYF